MSIWLPQSGLLELVEDSLNQLANEDLNKARPAAKTSDSNKKDLAVPTQAANEDPKSLFYDPFAIIEQLGFKDRPSQISYGTLEAMVYRTPIIRTIINTRIDQIAGFSRPSHDRYSMGFKIKLRDSDREPTKAEQKWARDAESLFVHTGVTDNARGRTNMTDFLKKTAFDSLVYDQYCWEIVPNKLGQPAEWYAVDGATIRLADSGTTYVDEDKLDQIRYVQIYDGVVIAEYTQDELCFGVRNPRSSIRLAGYGESELEMLVPTVTSLLYSWDYNQNFFKHGSANKGLLNIKGINNRNLQDFRRQWYMMATGVENAWRTPITSAEDLQWINMHQSNRDMEFNAWMDFLIKVACAMYKMDPVEVNFKYGNTGQGSAMSEASNREKVTLSKERGLRPILRNFEESFNRYILWPMNEDFEFEFVGLDAETRQEFADLTAKKVKTIMTVDELRAREDLMPLPDGKGEVILDSTWLQYSQAKDGMQAQEGMGAPGEEGEEEGQEGAPPEESDPGSPTPKVKAEVDKVTSSIFGKDTDQKKSLTKSWVAKI